MQFLNDESNRKSLERGNLFLSCFVLWVTPQGGRAMKKLLKPFFIVLILAVTLSACQVAPSPVLAQSQKPRDTQPQVSNTDSAILVDGNNAFALDLYHRLNESANNLFFSPYSISIALAMTYAGSAGVTENQMAQAMHFVLPRAQLHPAFDQLALELAQRATAEGVDPNQAFTLHVVNVTWGQTGYTFLTTYLDILAQDYGAGIRLLDFASNSETARNTINQWVSQETQNKINDILPAGSIDALTRLVLSNAIYFKADWSNEFDKSLTKKDVFHLVTGGTTTVPMMNRSGFYNYASGNGYQAVELPYAGEQLSMLIILPDEGKFSEAASSLDSATLAGIVSNLQSKNVNVTLPKFTFEYDLGLKSWLQQMGMVDAFDPTKADLSGMDGQKDLYISDVLHKAFVALDEAGTEAAAATTVIVGVTSMPVEQPIAFKADRPFIFLIRDNPTGTILFFGNMMDPTPTK
jgi:serpin B